MPDSNPIHDVHFSNPRKPTLGMEVMTLESLYKRGLDHTLTAPHRVHFYHIILFTRGTGVHAIDFTTYPYNNFTLMLVSVGQVHQYQINRSATGFQIVFTPEFLYENATELQVQQNLQVFEQGLFAPCIQLNVEQRRILKGLSLISRREYRRPTDEHASEIMRHLLRLMLLQIGRMQQVSAINQRVAPHYQEFVAFRRLVESNLGQSRSVQDYARQMALSPRKLNELTRHVLNKSAKEFIEEQVILEAQRLLAQGNMPIKEIAYRLGFSDPTNMVKFFKKHTQTSPAAFRSRFYSTN